MFTLGPPSEELRKKLLKEELKLRKKQPEHWAKSKYRKYANLQTNKKKKEEAELAKEALEIAEQIAAKKKEAKAAKKARPKARKKAKAKKRKK